METQNLFFERLKERLPENYSLVDSVVDAIGCSKDAAYRRMRGETALSIDETVTLAKTFNLSLNELSSQSDQSVVFRRGKHIHTVDDYRVYLQESLVQLEQIAATKHHMYYLAKDIPIFYQFAFPHLGAFKIYVWMKSVYNLEKLNGENYALKDVPADMLELAHKQWEVYSRLNTTEIWNDTTVLSLINQLEYYYEAGLLASREEALKIVEDFHAMMKVIYRQALSQQKIHAHNHEESSSATYAMYYHEILLMDNHILAEFKEDLRYYFVPYAGLNYMHTTDHDMTQDVKAYLDQATKKSSLISDVSEKERNKFFIRIKNRIERLREKIEGTDPFI